MRPGIYVLELGVLPVGILTHIISGHARVCFPPNPSVAAVLGSPEADPEIKV